MGDAIPPSRPLDTLHGTQLEAQRRREGMDRWMDRSSLPGKPRPSFSHSPPSLCSPHMCLISLPRRSHVWLGDPDSTPDRLFSRAWQIWLAGRRRSHPLENTEFCPHCSLSFKIPPPDVFQASHFTGVTRQQGLFLTPPL